MLQLFIMAKNCKEGQLVALNYKQTSNNQLHFDSATHWGKKPFSFFTKKKGKNAEPIKAFYIEYCPIFKIRYVHCMQDTLILLHDAMKWSEKNIPCQSTLWLLTHKKNKGQSLKITGITTGQIHE